MDVIVENKPPDKDSVKMIPDDRSDNKTRPNLPSSDNSVNICPQRELPTSRALRRGSNPHYVQAKDSNLRRGLSRSMDVIMNPAPRDNGSVKSIFSADTNNNSKRLENFRRKFSCPEIAAILDQYIPKDESSDTPPTAMPSPMRRSRSLNELPGSVRVPILKRTETERMKARLEASIAGTEELNKLRENQEKLMAETRSSVNIRKHQNRRQSNPTRLSSSHLTRIFEEENGQEDSDQEVFYENQSSKGKYSDPRSPRRTQSYRESGSASFIYQNQNTRPHNNEYRQYSDNIERVQNDSTHSWSMLTQKAESFSDTPVKRNIRSNSMFVGNTASGKPPSLLSQSEASPSSVIDSKLRRSSMQSDAILTGWNRSDKSASIFENMDIKSTSPNPIRAVLMQYEVSKRSVPLNLKRSPTKPAPMKAFRKDSQSVAVSRNVLANDSLSVIRSDDQIQNSPQRSSVCQNPSDKTFQNDKRMELSTHESNLNESQSDPQYSLDPYETNDCDKPVAFISNQGGDENNPNANVFNNKSLLPKPNLNDPNREKSLVECHEGISSSITPTGTPKHMKYNSIASDDSLLTPSNYSSFCSSNLSSLSYNSTSRLPCFSIDEGFIESPPVSPDHTQQYYSFQGANGDKHSIITVSDTPASKASDIGVQKKKIKEIPSNSRTQTEV